MMRQTGYDLKGSPWSGVTRDNLFAWTIFLLGLAAVTFLCWLGSFYVFGHPEQPRSYHLLRKLNKLPPPARFLVTKAPPGDFLDAQKIFERYSKYTNLQMERENQLYARNFIRNYSETKKLVPYLTGKYQVLAVYELRQSDFFPSGVVALTQAVDFPQVLAELVYTAAPQNMEDIKSLLRPGVEVRLDRTLDLSAVVHVGRIQDGRLHLTVVPLLYGQYALKNGLGSFSLEPPKELNVGAGLPLIRGEEVKAVFREQIEQRKKRVAVQSAPDPVSPADASEVVRMDLPKPPSAETATAKATAVAPPEAPGGGSDGASGVAAGKLPTTDVSTPPAKGTVADAGLKPPVNNSGPTAAEKNRSNKNNTKPPALTAEPAPPKVLPIRPGAGTASAETGKVPANAPPVVVGAVRPQAAVAPSHPEGGSKERNGLKNPDAVSAGSSSAGGRETAPPRVMAVAAPSSDGALAVANAPLVGRPVVVVAPSMTPAGRSESWKTYGSGKQPTGRSVSMEQAVSLKGRNDGAPLYLRGKFLVTAADRNQAVMREESPDLNAVPTRVIVEYPSGSVPPARGSSVTRGESRGFEIREVRRGADGHINIYVREVFAP
jgi:hypothetical protein